MMFRLRWHIVLSRCFGYIDIFYTRIYLDVPVALIYFMHFDFWMFWYILRILIYWVCWYILMFRNWYMLHNWMRWLCWYIDIFRLHWYIFTYLHGLIMFTYLDALTVLIYCRFPVVLIYYVYLYPAYYTVLFITGIPARRPLYTPLASSSSTSCSLEG